MPQLVEQDNLRQRAHWLIRLRWLAAAAVVLATFVCTHVLGLSLPSAPLYGIAALLLVYNFVVFFLLEGFGTWRPALAMRRGVVRDTDRPTHTAVERTGRRIKSVIDLQISADLVILTILVHFSGGPESPLVLFFIFHVIIASILLSVWESFLQATLAVVLLAGLLLLEATGVVPHICLKGLIRHCRYEEQAYLAAMFATFVLTVYLVVYLTSYIALRLRRAEEAQREANRQLRAKDRIKDEYVAHLTHDIKGHLAAIQSCLGVAATDLGREPERDACDGACDPAGPADAPERAALISQAADFVERAYLRTKKLTAFVRMLLRLTRLKLDGNLEMVPFCVGEAVRESVEAVQLAVREKSLRLASVVTPGAATISGNALSFKEALMNLLLNAVKYTPPDGTVSIKTEILDRSVVVEIADTGIGIPPEEQGRVFEEFYRASNARKAQPDGDGLGLSLVKRVVEMHGGTIQFSSRLGSGTTFRLVLPLDASATVPDPQPAVPKVVAAAEALP
jgi:signal transduction histidine kinase